MISHSLIALGASHYNNSEAERDENDFYATEPLAIDLLMKVEDLSPIVWECACGNGHLSERLKEKGKQVLCSDLIVRDYECTQADFFQINPEVKCDIVTNPPFKLAEEFIRHGLEVLSDGYKLCLFLKLSFLESETRDDLFKTFPPVRIHVCRKRVKCAKNGQFENVKSSPTCYAWFVWEKNKYNQPMIIDRI